VLAAIACGLGALCYPEFAQVIIVVLTWVIAVGVKLSTAGSSLSLMSALLDRR